MIYFLKNPFIKKPDTISGLKVDFDAIDYPVYVLGTKKDHIVPWESCYAAFEIYKDVTYCLGGAGHVAGIINPPYQKKYGYNTNETQKQSPGEWFLEAHFHSGSWWTHWHQWIKPHLGKKRLARQGLENEMLEKTPGRYALQKAPQI